MITDRPFITISLVDEKYIVTHWFETLKPPRPVSANKPLPEYEYEVVSKDSLPMTDQGEVLHQVRIILEDEEELARLNMEAERNSKPTAR